MKLGINILLSLLILLFAFLLYNSIKEPIAFKAQKDMRKKAVVDRLMEIRTSQEMYKDMTGEFAKSFDALRDTLKMGKIEFEKIIEDPNEPDNKDLWERVVTYSSAIDSINKLGINLDSLRFVPYANTGTKFNLSADTMTYQKTLVHVIEVSTRWKDFMGPYASERFAKYDNSYKPNKLMKFGDMGKPTISGNWEL